MFKIGDFSKLTQVSAKMLRHYDEIGLLKPARADPENGYRYYSAQQVPRLNRLMALKDLGFSLEQIGQMLDDNISVEALGGMLKLRQLEIEARLQTEQARLKQVRARLEYLEQEQHPPHYDIVLRPLPSLLVASIRQTVPNQGQAITDLFDQLEAYIQTQGARAFHSPMTIYHDADYRESDLEVEVAVPLTQVCPAPDPIQVYPLAAWDSAACLVYTGAYDKIAAALQALLRWIEGQGYQVVGPIREVYLRFGAPPSLKLPPAFLTDDSRAYVTELQIPIAKAPFIEESSQSIRSDNK